MIVYVRSNTWDRTKGSTYICMIRIIYMATMELIIRQAYVLKVLQMGDIITVYDLLARHHHCILFPFQSSMALCERPIQYIGQARRSLPVVPALLLNWNLKSRQRIVRKFYMISFAEYSYCLLNFSEVNQAVRQTCVLIYIHLFFYINAFIA